MAQIKKMNSEILYQGSMPVVQVHLQKGERIKAEAGAMVYMDATVDVEGKAQGGIAKGLGRMITGESFFLQELAANRGDGKAMLAPKNIGNIIEINMTGKNWMIQKGSFLASEMSINTKVKSQGLGKALFSGEGLFIILAEGTGKIWLSSFGGIHKLDLNNEEVVIDNGHLVAWEESLQYNIEKASSGWVSSFTSGEGLVCRFKGTGTVYIQTRNFGSFLSMLPLEGGKSKGIVGRLLGGG